MTTLSLQLITDPDLPSHQYLIWHWIPLASSNKCLLAVRHSIYLLHPSHHHPSASVFASPHFQCSSQRNSLTAKYFSGFHLTKKQSECLSSQWSHWAIGPFLTYSDPLPWGLFVPVSEVCICLGCHWRLFSQVPIQLASFRASLQDHLASQVLVIATIQPVPFSWCFLSPSLSCFFLLPTYHQSNVSCFSFLEKKTQKKEGFVLSLLLATDSLEPTTV